MTKALPEVQTLPTTRPAGCPFDPPPEMAHRRPLSRLLYNDGHVGWLVTGYALAREVLADPRFSSRRELMRMPYPGAGDRTLPPAPPGHLHGMDAPEHTRYRRQLIGKFTVRRMERLTARLEENIREHLDAMANGERPVDLVDAYAFPIAALTICELLGVPRPEQEQLKREARLLNSLDAPPEEVYAAVTSLNKRVGELVAAKRREPTDDLLSDLTATDLTDEELAGIGTVLMGAGLDTVASMIALSVLVLLTNPDQLAALRRDPGLVNGAVEELLRYLSVEHTIVRTAMADVELGGQLVRAGDSVTISLHAANRDPDQFADPDTADPRRGRGGHVAFGHGIHQCLGKELARAELRVALSALLARFPTLRLAVAPGEVPVLTNVNYTVQRLPVTWDGD